jgi:hypothetical protein
MMIETVECIVDEMGCIEPHFQKISTHVTSGYLKYFQGLEGKKLKITIEYSTMPEGCRRALADGQWWKFCGETDMGQSLQALCIECGGEYMLAEVEDD